MHTIYGCIKRNRNIDHMDIIVLMKNADDIDIQ